ncbi:MAG TPA: hypothetical protein VF205_10720 [Nitrospiraceae bacterium]
MRYSFLCCVRQRRQHDRALHQVAQPIRLRLERPIDSLGIQPRIDGGMRQTLVVEYILNRGEIFLRRAFSLAIKDNKLSRNPVSGVTFFH